MKAAPLIKDLAPDKSLPVAVHHNSNVPYISPNGILLRLTSS